VIAILVTFGHGDTYSLTEIARLAGLSVSTAYRLTTELVDWGMLERTDDGQYRIGLQLKILGSQAAELPATVAEQARAVMEDLAAACSYADVRLGVLADLKVTFVERAAGSRPMPVSFEPAILPAHATAMGKALLAFSPPRIVDMVIARGLKPYTRWTVTKAVRLRRCLAVTRLTRIAVARGELEPDDVAVAAPVFGAGRDLVAALELHSRERQDIRLMQAPLIVAARSLSRELATLYTQGQPSTNGNGSILGRLAGGYPAPASRYPLRTNDS
jgi:DNA-binding IclR family transcriptional regulator